MTYHLSRSQAAKHAIRKGWSSFWAFSQPNGQYGRIWKVSEMPSPCPAADWKSRDYVSHVETHRIDEGRVPGLRGVIVVTCFKSEIPKEDLALAKEQGHTFEPITPSLWFEKDKDRKTNKAPAAPRARSEAANPSKLVWEIAETMPGASRQDVVAACIEKGVNKSTAQTQYYRWLKSKK